MTPKIQITLLILTVLLLTACGNSASVLSEAEKVVEQETAALPGLTATVVDEAEKGAETPAPSAPKTTAVHKATTPPEATEKITVPEPLPATTTPVLAAATPTVVAGQELTTKTPTPISPTPTFTSSPTALPEEPAPSPAAKVLPPLDENLQTIVFTTQGEQGPEIWRVQVDEQGQQTGTAVQVDFPADFRTSIRGLYPSPNGRQVAIWELYGAGGTFIHILDISGKLISLFGEHPNIDPRAVFLDWSPDGQNILVQGGTGNPDLGDSVWLVDVNTHVYRDVNIKQVDEIPSITSASFSPDGKSIVYAQTTCYQCGSEIWRIDLDNSNRQLLFEDSKTRVEDVSWSPNGDYIAFNQWLESNEVASGELHVMKPDGSAKLLLGSTLTGYYDLFKPSWSSNGRQIVFVASGSSESPKELGKLSGNLYVADVLTNQVRQLTHFQNTQVIKPTWSPDGSQVAFLASENSSQFTPLKVIVDGDELQRLGVNDVLDEAKPNNLSTQSSNLNVQSSIVWLP
jgi:hypothetical protein